MMDAVPILAYIDPGTGSMLFTLVVGLLGAGYFALRGLWVRLKFLLSGGRATKGGKRIPYVIFSDDKRYWNVFKPICDEFERRGIEVVYWTQSPSDPALGESYKHVKCEFIGEGNRGFARLNTMSADVCLATTPGLDVYQWKRSKDVKCYVHMFHTVGTALGYRMFGIDAYDSVLLTGGYQIEEIRYIENARAIPHKELEIVGSTYLDQNMLRYDKSKRPVNKRPVVLLAPSWGPNAILAKHGERIINALLETGYEIVVRPHPQSKTSDREILRHLMKDYPSSANLDWNFDIDNFEILNRADVMITDFSGVAFDFTTIFDKPVIFVLGDYDESLYDAAWYGKPQWRFSLYSSFGVSLSEKQFPEMQAVIDDVILNSGLAEGRKRAREEVWAFPGESVRRTVDYLVKKHDETGVAARGDP